MLADYLHEVQLEIETKREIKLNCVISHGFRKGFSIITNALNHRNKRYVFNADIKAFSRP